MVCLYKMKVNNNFVHERAIFGIIFFYNSGPFQRNNNSQTFVDMCIVELQRISFLRANRKRRVIHT